VEHCNFWTLQECAVVFVCANYKIRVLLAGLLYHLEQRTLLLLAVYDEYAVEDLVAAVLAVNLGESEHLTVCKAAAKLLAKALKVLNLLRIKGKALLFVVLLKILYINYRIRLFVNCKDLLVEPVVQALQHLVILRLLLLCAEELLYALYAANVHILGNLHCSCTPRGNHLPSWANEFSFYCLLLQLAGIPKQPLEGICILLRNHLLSLNGYYRICAGTKE